MKKKIPIIIVAMVILVLLGLIINNLFGGSDSPRIKNGDKHTLTNKEKNAKQFLPRVTPLVYQHSVLKLQKLSPIYRYTQSVKA